MLVIRFFRVGKKNQPSFKVVVTDKNNPPRAGRFTEEVGFYNPLTKQTVLNKERVQYWISKGAQPSPTAYNLFIKEGVLEGKKIAVHKKSKKPIDVAQGKPAAVPAAAEQVAPVTQAAPVETAAPAPASAEATAGKPAETPAPAEIQVSAEVPAPVPEPPKEEPKPEAK